MNAAICYHNNKNIRCLPMGEQLTKMAEIEKRLLRQQDLKHVCLSVQNRNHDQNLMN